MALRYIDGFDTYTTLSTRWDGVLYGRGSITTNPSRFGGKALQLTSSAGCGVYMDFGLQPTWYVGVAIWIYAIGNRLLTFADVDTRQVDLLTDVSGHLFVTRNGTVIGSVGTTVLHASMWYFIEFGATIGSSAGSFEVRINGVTEITGTGLNTQATSHAGANRIWLGSDPFAYYDDLYICDANGPVNNGFLGDCRVESLLPSGAGSKAQWTPLSGDNYANVNQNPPDDDTTYNKSNMVGETDTYAMTDLVSTTGIIYGVQKMNYVRKDNAGSRSVAPVLRIGGTDHVGASTSIGDSYTYTREIEEVSPATLSAFTISEVNAMEAGIVVTA